MKIKLIFTIMLLPLLIFGQKGLINKGMKIVVSEGSSIVIQDDFVNQSLGDTHHGSITSDGELIIGGDWHNNALSGFVFNSFNETGVVHFGSPSIQTIGGSKATYFENLSLNTNALLLQADIKTSGNIDLVDGIIKLGDHNLTLEANTQISGAFSNTSMIATNGTGVLQQLLSGAASFSFPLGDSNMEEEYSPLEVNVNSFSGANNSYLSLRVDNVAFDVITDNTDYLNRYWTIGGDGVNAINYDATFSYTDADVVGNENNLYATRFVGTEKTVHNTVNAASNTFEVIDNTEFAVYTAMDNATGIDKVINAEALIVYPNPNNGKFRLKSHVFLESEAFVEIVDETGRVIEKKEVQSFEYNTSNGIEFDLQNKYKGLILIRIVTDVQIMQQQVIIY